MDDTIDWDRWLYLRPRHLKENPAYPKYLLLPEIRRLLDAIQNDYYAALADTIWHTGSRIAEAQRLRKMDFDFTHADTGSGYVLIQSVKSRPGPGGTPKDKQRLVPVSDPDYLRHMQRFLSSKAGRAREPVFTKSNQAFYNYLQKAGKQANLTPEIQLSAHTIRHSFAVNALLHGVPINIIQRWLGHSSLKTTLIYVDLLEFDTMYFANRVKYR